MVEFDQDQNQQKDRSHPKLVATLISSAKKPSRDRSIQNFFELIKLFFFWFFFIVADMQAKHKICLHHLPPYVATNLLKGYYFLFHVVLQEPWAFG